MFGVFLQMDSEVEISKFPSVDFIEMVPNYGSDPENVLVQIVVPT